MIDQEKFEYLLPLALEWAKTQEEMILRCGVPLGPAFSSDARRVGVQDCARVRVLIVERIHLPENAELAEAARRGHIITEASRGAAVGYGIIIRADSWGDREVMIHQLAHVAQCERSGGLESFLKEYLGQRQTCATFSIGAFEEEARGMAREICSARTAAS
ncbi:MAG TPA: hypothetical protein VGG94_01355 [Chthoniobacterales bacterium]|jgi:hypothetical protein